MKDYTTKLAENETATKRWISRLVRATYKVDGLRRQRVNLLRAQSKALSKEATDLVNKTADVFLGDQGEPAKKPKPAKRTKPERRINL